MINHRLKNNMCYLLQPGSNDKIPCQIRVQIDTNQYPPFMIRPLCMDKIQWYFIIESFGKSYQFLSNFTRCFFTASHESKDIFSPEGVKHIWVFPKIGAPKMDGL